MNAVLVLSIGIVILIVGYIFYGGWLAKQWGVDDSRPTPAHELEDGMPRIRPHSQHMCTYLSAVVLCDQADPDALAQLQKLKKHRDFKLSLHGWMEFRIAAVDLSTGEITTNRAGKPFGKDLKRMVERVIANHKGEEKTQ